MNIVLESSNISNAIFRYWHHLRKGAETSGACFKSFVAWLLLFLPTIFVPLAMALRLLAGTVLRNLPGGSLPDSEP
jgi:hypothetical protein